MLAIFLLKSDEGGYWHRQLAEVIEKVIYNDFLGAHLFELLICDELSTLAQGKY